MNLTDALAKANEKAQRVQEQKQADAMAFWRNLWRRPATRKGRIAASMYCPHCGTTGTPRKVTKGSFGIEVLLWLFFLLPGLIYSVWRLASRYEACGTCHQAGMIPADSPRAREFKRRGGGIEPPAGAQPSPEKGPEK